MPNAAPTPPALAHQTIPIAVTAPLRIFLGITFLYAGIQKLTDPGFFNPHAITYIGTQLALFAQHSPIGGFLSAVAVPHAMLFGGLVAWGEVAIGLGTLAGALFRPAAFFGALLSLTLWLSATWQVKPYFYGADIFALFGWVTLLLAGSAGWLAVDVYLGAWLATHIPQRWHSPALAQALTWLELAPTANVAKTPLPPPKRGKSHRLPATTTRRELLQGVAAGSVVTLVGVWLWQVFHSGSDPAAISPPTATQPAAVGTAAASTPAASTPAASNIVANLSSLPPNSAATFQIPSNQDPGVVVRLSGGSVVAYDATCTHAGCTVQYDQGSQLLLCPCHGAAFDPAKGAAVVQGPAPVPLTTVAVAVNQQTGNITLN